MLCELRGDTMSLNHIQITSQPGHSWCGVPLTDSFHFKDVEAAALNGLYDNRLPACLECIEAAITALRTNHND